MEGGAREPVRRSAPEYLQCQGTMQWKATITAAQAYQDALARDNDSLDI